MVLGAAVVQLIISVTVQIDLRLVFGSRLDSILPHDLVELAYLYLKVLVPSELFFV